MRAHLPICLPCNKENCFLVLLGNGTLSVILLLFVIQCGKNIFERISLIRNTAE